MLCGILLAVGRGVVGRGRVVVHRGDVPAGVGCCVIVQTVLSSLLREVFLQHSFCSQYSSEGDERYRSFGEGLHSACGGL